MFFMTLYIELSCMVQTLNATQGPMIQITAKAPENGWLEDVISFWEGLFPGANC